MGEENASKMGIGKVGKGRMHFIDKHYWVFQIDFTEAEIHLTAKMKLTHRPKQGENEITTILYEYQDINDEITRLYEHLYSEKPQNKQYGTGLLTIWLPDHTKFTEETGLWNCPMRPTEQWRLSDLELTGMNFSDLDFEHSDPVTVEFTWKYSTAIYRNLCPDKPLPKS
jgi:hypothetical protein